MLLAAVAAAVFVVGLVAPGAAARLDRLLQRAAGAVAHLLSIALAVAAWVLMLLPVWATSRMVRYSPIRSGWTDGATAWTFVDRARLRGPDLRVDRPHRSGMIELSVAPRVRRRAALRLVPVVVALVLLGAWTIDRRSAPQVQAQVAELAGRAPLMRGEAKNVPDDELQINGYPVTDYAHEDEPWFRDYTRELLGYNTLPDLILGARNGEFTGEYLNVVDGHRVTYTPDDPVLDVWFFGGSTMFGIGQRDDHTIPSVIARLAEDDGIRIRATNFGVSGDVNWQGTLRFAEALDDPDLPDPDLVVFYDGWNDQSLGEYRAEIGSLDPTASERLPFSDLDREREGVILGGRDRMGPGSERTALAIPVAAAQYARGVRTGRAIAAAEGVEIAHFWQPIAGVKRLSPADDELTARTGLRPEWWEIRVADYAAIRTVSGVDPIDLSTVMDDIDRPVYFDQGHTNEFGAEVVATAMYDSLRDSLQRLDGTR
jgi:lysophospholipase L1-like esterase